MVEHIHFSKHNRRDFYLRLIPFLITLLLLRISLAVAQTNYCLTTIEAREKMSLVTLKWTHNGSAMYTIYRSNTGPLGNFNEIGTTENTYSAFMDNTVQVNQMYYYKVRGANDCYSPVVNVMPRVRARNMPPTINSTPLTLATDGQKYEYEIIASDPNGDQLSYYLDVAPNGMSIHSTGKIEWLPNEAGTVWVGIRVTDGYLCNLQYYQINTQINVQPLTIDILHPSTSVTIKGSWATVSGTVQPVVDEIGVVVNNVPAVVQKDKFTATNIPLITGKNKIIAIATSTSGDQATDSIEFNIDVLIPEPVRIEVNSPSAWGVSPLQVDFKVSSNIDSIIMYQWDFNGDGSLDSSGADLSSISQTYENSGVFTASVFLTDNNNSIFSGTQLITVTTIGELVVPINKRWDELKTAFLSNDTSQALATFHSGVKDKFYSVISKLNNNLVQIGNDLEQIKFTSLNGDIVEMVSFIGPAGNKIAHFIYFAKDKDGLWKILEM